VVRLGRWSLARDIVEGRLTALLGMLWSMAGLVVFALLLVWWVIRRLRPPAPRLEVVRDEAA
jgi:hypothetical protein